MTGGVRAFDVGVTTLPFPANILAFVIKFAHVYRLRVSAVLAPADGVRNHSPTQRWSVGVVGVHGVLMIAVCRQANLLFYRRMAEEWRTSSSFIPPIVPSGSLTILARRSILLSLALAIVPAVQHQASLAKRLVNAGLPSVTGMPAANLAKRPFLLFWFMSQIERCVSVLCTPPHTFACLMFESHSLGLSNTAMLILAACLILGHTIPLAVPTRHGRFVYKRALTLWSYDQTLSIALDVAKALSRPVEWLMALWPCPGADFT